MLNRMIKISFAALGGVTGITLIQTLLFSQFQNASLWLKAAIYLIAAAVGVLLFYVSGNRIIEYTMNALDKLEQLFQRLTLYELMLSAIGLVVGLVVANLITIPIKNVAIVGAPIAIVANILLSGIGVAIAVGKKNENLFDAAKGRGVQAAPANSVSCPKILDTSVIIDGRIVDVIRSGFIEGELVVPGFVLEELRHIADSQDTLKRNRGRRGLDVLNMIQKELEIKVRTENIEVGADSEVDSALLKLAQKLGGKVLTIDYNLNKVASFQGVPVMNINELANAVKPIALPGEEMTVQVIRDGKENGQGIGYLEDGTMIVIDGGRRHIGESLNVTVTSILQTAAGRMIFAKPKYSIERIV